MRKLACTLGMALALGGCALFPSHINAPESPPYTIKDKQGQSITITEWADAEKHSPSLNIPPTVKYSELRAQINVYSTYWVSSQGELMLERDIAARGRDGAVLLAAYYAVRSQFKQARYGGLVAALFGSYSDTYQVEVQAKNYMTAGKMMVCIGQAIDKVPKVAWDYFSDKGEFASPDISFPSGTIAENLAVLNDTFPSINRLMNRVLWRLLEDQRSLKLSGVNLETLRAAYDKEKQALERATNSNNAPAIATPEFSTLAAPLQRIQTDLVTARILALKLLPADAEKCLGSGGA